MVNDDGGSKWKNIHKNKIYTLKKLAVAKFGIISGGIK